MKEHSALTVWTWRLLSVPPLYAALTLAAATLAAPPENPGDPFGAMHRGFMPVAEALPGAGALTQARRIAAQIRQDAAIARDEAIRERVRRHGR